MSQKPVFVLWVPGCIHFSQKVFVEQAEQAGCFSRPGDWCCWQILSRCWPARGRKSGAHLNWSQAWIQPLQGVVMCLGNQGGKAQLWSVKLKALKCFLYGPMRKPETRLNVVRSETFEWKKAKGIQLWNSELCSRTAAHLPCLPTEWQRYNVVCGGLDPVSWPSKVPPSDTWTRMLSCWPFQLFLPYCSTNICQSGMIFFFLRAVCMV